ncbi:MAG TPA: saccharopine dehydrogenase C-terminal domain-containing protein [Candidatus Krumholzibacteria bacterium]|nr:saccharopine dehydrogenase C-terminal domain-containing protein [Candidatus Krumholzibacteria bacterium]
MRCLLLGAGMQARAIAHDLLAQPDLEELAVVEHDAAVLEAFVADNDDARLTYYQGDVRDEALLGPLLADADVCLSAVNYWYNDDLTRLAIAGACHFLDLGGNNDVVARQFARHDAAAAAGVTVLPDCGLAPGLAGLLGWHLAQGWDRCDRVRLRVGGLPAAPRPPLDYMIVFAVQGLINEYIEPCLVLRDGAEAVVPGMSEVETLAWDGLGELEAFQTSGGCSTLTRTLRGSVRDLDYKTIRYPGHAERIRLLMDLGLTGSDPVRTPAGEVRPRDVLGACLEAACPKDGPDLVLLRAEAEGVIGGMRRRRRIEILDREDPATGLTAMMRMTGFPAAILGAMLARGEIDAPGARPQELVVPVPAVIAALRERGIAVTETAADLD